MDAVVERLRAELTGRYEVEQELGHGGMAVVYLAKDLRHERRVAIKVLRQDVGGASAERFLREIRTVAALHHPHILQLLDSGTAGDHLFYVMPYVEGETIRQRLEREGPLPIDEAVRITKEVADALAFAHARGIVHRDIKPENIFLSAGHALVADFGIARAASAASETTLTDVGLAVGTPAYMSPEQATAEPRIDGRSDQYALGCVLYEMLAGAPPFTGPTSQSIMARHTADPVPPLRTVRDVPPALESAITKALAKMPADRWTDTTAFANSLESATRNTDVRPVTAPRRRLVPIVGAAVVILAAVVGYRLASRETTSIDAAPDSLRSVALQRFRFSGDTTFFWVAETFAEGLYPGLTKVAGIRVKPATNSQETYDDAFEFGRLLGVDAVITGDVQVRSNLLRVSAWLTNVADSALRSLGNFYGELQVNGAPRDIYRITDSIAVEIVAALKPNLSPERRAVAERGQRTTLLQALVLYQRARAEAGVDRTGASWERARELAEQAVRLDPNFSDAIVFLHQATVASMTIAGRTPTQAAQAVDGLLDRAIRADSLNGYAYAVRANFRAMFRREWNESLADFRKALELSPSSPDVLIDFAFAMTDRDQPDSALYYMRKAFDLVSVDAGVLHDLAMTLYFNGYPDSAYKAASVALTMNPGWTNYLVLMHSLLDKGRVAEADSMAEKYLAVGYQSTQALAYAAFYFMRSGNAKRARAMADSIFAHARRKYVPASEVATAYLAIGDTTKALDAIERADRQRDIMLANNLWFTLSPLAGNPRYERVVRAVFGDRPVRRTFSSSQR